MKDFARFCTNLRKRIEATPLCQDWADCCSALLADDAMLSWAVHLSVNACLAAGGKAQAATPIGAAWLALNRAAYLMDGIQDHEISVSNRDAQNYSMALFFAAHDFLLDVPHKYLHQVLRVFSESGHQAVLGQHQSFALNREMPPEEALKSYLRATVLKSGSLFSVATAGGAAVATHDQATIVALGDYGKALGTIHQMLDDCRDALDGPGDYEISLPAILYSMAIKNQAITLPPVRSGDALLKILNESGAFQVMSNVLLHWRQSGLDSLSGLNDGDAVEELKKLLTNTLREEFIQVNL